MAQRCCFCHCASPPLIKCCSQLRPTESVAGDFVAPFYVSATFTNKIYKFENITKLENGTVRATQKMVGNAVAPSTVYPIEDTHSGKVQGLLVAEGNPFWVNSPMHPSHMQVFKGGVTYLDKDNCTDMFPLKPETDYKEGKVVNTVDCHEATGVCFFSVWKFYDDQPGMWSNKSAPDCPCIGGHNVAKRLWARISPVCAARPVQFLSMADFGIKALTSARVVHTAFVQHRLVSSIQRLLLVEMSFSFCLRDKTVVAHGAVVVLLLSLALQVWASGPLHVTPAEVNVAAATWFHFADSMPTALVCDSFNPTVLVIAPHLIPLDTDVSTCSLRVRVRVRVRD